MEEEQKKKSSLKIKLWEPKPGRRTHVLSAMIAAVSGERVMQLDGNCREGRIPAITGATGAETEGGGGRNVLCWCQIEIITHLFVQIPNPNH